MKKYLATKAGSRKGPNVKASSISWCLGVFVAIALKNKHRHENRKIKSQIRRGEPLCSPPKKGDTHHRKSNDKAPNASPFFDGQKRAAKKAGPAADGCLHAWLLSALTNTPTPTSQSAHLSQGMPLTRHDQAFHSPAPLRVRRLYRLDSAAGQ